MFYIVNKFFNIPRRVKKEFYIRWNYIKFHLLGITLGRGSEMYDKVYINVCLGAKVSIGDFFCFTSGDCINPLCRNIKGAIIAEKNAFIKIGHNVGISSGCIWAYQSITIGDHVKIGGNCLIMDSDAHSLNYVQRRDEKEDQCFKNNKSIVIDDDVLLGAHCIVLKGVHIGARSVIGAGSVVTKDIPGDCIAGGNPCKVIKYL